MAMEYHFFSVILHLESVGPVENETERAGFHGVMLALWTLNPVIRVQISVGPAVKDLLHLLDSVLST